jgi:hypothetical protein
VLDEVAHLFDPPDHLAICIAQALSQDHFFDRSMFGRPFSRRTRLQMLNTTNDARASDHDR